MKQTQPKPPVDAPAGTAFVGGPLNWFSISFIVTADDLNPEEITHLFGVQPTRTQRRDVPLTRNDGSIKRVPKFGSWTLQLKRADIDEWDLNEATKLLIGRLPTDLSVWRQLPASHSRIFFGLELANENQGFGLDPEILRFAADRNIQLDFDIYARAPIKSAKAD